jgi:ATP-dependent Clp protease, protease subunit
MTRTRSPLEPAPAPGEDPGADPGGAPLPAVPPMAELARLSPFARLYERRIVFLRGPLKDDVADMVCAELIGLDADGPDPITLYIDSPGGDTFGMFAIHDTVQLLRAPVDTVCMGLAASAGAFLLATGTGTRSATPNARIMIHQPLGGGRGTASDIAILAEEFRQLRRRMEAILAERTGQPVERIAADTNRDFWLSADEALAYGLIDEVRSPRPRVARAV